MSSMKKTILVSVAVAAALVLVFSALNLFVLLRTDKYIVSAPALDSEGYDCILVLGAGIREDGTPSDMLKDRLITAIGLYKLGVSDTIFLSGDRSGDHYDEVAVMKSFCLENSIPENSLVCDYIGYSTYESIHNVRVAEYDKIVVVTQEYHLSRAIYIAQKMDIEAHGISADVRTYRGQFARDVRESFARIKDIVKTNTTNGVFRFLGISPYCSENKGRV